MKVVEVFLELEAGEEIDDLLAYSNNVLEKLRLESGLGVPELSCSRILIGEDERRLVNGELLVEEDDLFRDFTMGIVRLFGLRKTPGEVMLIIVEVI